MTGSPYISFVISDLALQKAQGWRAEERDWMSVINCQRCSKFMNFISLAFKSPGKLNRQRWRCPGSPVNHPRGCMAAWLRKAIQIKKTKNKKNTWPHHFHTKKAAKCKGKYWFFSKKKQKKASLPGTHWLDNPFKETLVERQSPHFSTRFSYCSGDLC